MTISDCYLVLPYLQYGINFNYTQNMPDWFNDIMNKQLTNSFDVNLHLDDVHFIFNNRQYLKPYLRPLSSMSDNEKNEIAKLLNYEFYVDDDGALCAEDDRHRVRVDLISTYINYLYSHHFDFNNLIENNIAIEAPQNMY